MEKNGKSKRKNSEVLIPSYHENYEEDFEENDRRQEWITSIMMKSAYEKGFREGIRQRSDQLDRLLAGSILANLALFLLVLFLAFFL